jgi:hypothetical protein
MVFFLSGLLTGLLKEQAEHQGAQTDDNKQQQVKVLHGASFKLIMDELLQCEPGPTRAGFRLKSD